MTALSRYVMFAAIAVACSSPNAAVKNYCNELDLNKDYTENNPRVFKNPRKSSCRTGFELPGFGPIPGVNETLCDSAGDIVRAATNRATKLVNQRLSKELNNIKADASEKLNDLETAAESGVIDQVFGESAGQNLREVSNKLNRTDLSSAATAPIKENVNETIDDWFKNEPEGRKEPLTENQKSNPGMFR